MIPVKDVMTRDVITFSATTPVGDIAQILTRHHITGAPVVSAEGHVLGIVSEVDVFTKKGATAADIMSPHVISVSEETGIEEAAKILASERIRRVPVISRGKMVGLLSRSDVLDFFAHSQWTCQVCGHEEHGLENPGQCSRCQSSDFRLMRASPGS
jgi:CBS domain-containing protein